MLITRPKSQNQALATLLRQQGGHVLIMPTIKIQPITLDANSATEQKYAMIIFVSGHAVAYGLPPLSSNQALKQAKIVAIGGKTSQALSRAGISPDIVPKKFNTESLLKTEALQEMTGKRILIVRGQGGRETLATELRQRGAQVDYLEVYRRVLPSNVETTTMDTGKKGGIDSIITTSNEGLQNLVTLCAYAPWVFMTQLFVFSQRGADLAKTLGFIKPALITKETSNRGILNALIQWKNSERIDTV